MKKDFANKTKKRGNATRFNDQEPNNSGLITIVLGVVLGVGVTLLAFFLYFQPTDENATQVEKQPVKEKPSAKTRYKAVPPEEVEESEFSFHDELENKTIEVEPEIPAEIKNLADRTYTMQCGAFRQQSMAEKQRAMLTLNGFEPIIRATVSEAGTTWYRVVLGPYQSKRQATRDKNQLVKSNIECRIW